MWRKLRGISTVIGGLGGHLHCVWGLIERGHYESVRGTKRHYYCEGAKKGTSIVSRCYYCVGSVILCNTQTGTFAVGDTICVAQSRHYYYVGH